MHEYSIVQALVGQVEKEADARHAINVHKVKVRLGERSGVDPQLLQTAYDTFRAGTICAKAPLELTQVPALFQCPKCGKAIAKGAPLQCPACGEPAKMVQGDEIMLVELDLEVP